MEIVRFRVSDQPQYGVIDPNTGKVVGLKGDPLFSKAEPSGQFFEASEIRRLSPVIPRSKIVCCVDPAFSAEAPANSNRSSVLTVTTDRDFPRLALRPNTTVIGPDDPVNLPAWSSRVMAQTSLALVIKTLAKQVAVEDAAQVIAGFTIATDFTAQDVVEADGGLLTRAKSWDTSCPVGPGIIVDPDLNYADLMLETLVNGEVVASTSVADFAYGPLEVVSAVSQVMTLLPGDLILVGGVANPPAVKAGDQVASVISPAGSLENRILAQ